jgi:riboflavin synthase
MFTGIIECTGKIIEIKSELGNKTFYVQSNISNQLKVDQSLAHNGVCLTVVELKGNIHAVTAVQETLTRSNFDLLKINDEVNLERAMIMNARLDGHIVQGHVDETATCISVDENNGSWEYRFQLDKDTKNVLVQKGSVCVNGVSLTVVNPDDYSFGVAIIPYTYEHTNFNSLRKGDTVNIEFDIIGKYIERLMKK